MNSHKQGNTNTQHGRFTSVDPLTGSANVKDPQTLNRYSYPLNSPYKFSDPLGLVANGVAQGSSGGSDVNHSYLHKDLGVYSGIDFADPFVLDTKVTTISRKDFAAFGDEIVTPQRIGGANGNGYNPPNVRQDTQVTKRMQSPVWNTLRQDITIRFMAATLQLTH